MIPSTSPLARQTWAKLEGSDFDAVDDLIALLEDADADGFWGHLETLTEFGSGGEPVRVVQTPTALLAMVASDRLEIFALGRPGL